MESPDENPERSRPKTLATTPGMHRFVWDLRFTGPNERLFTEDDEEEDDDRSKLRGPMAPPGTYQAKLTVGERSESHAFEVALDPRVAAEGVTAEEVERQTIFVLEVRESLNAARGAADRLQEALKESEGSEENGDLERIKAELVTNKVRYSRPMLLDQLEYLYRNHMKADQEPGAEARRRFAVLETELARILDELERILEDRESD